MPTGRKFAYLFTSVALLAGPIFVPFEPSYISVAGNTALRAAEYLAGAAGPFLSAAAVEFQDSFQSAWTGKQAPKASVAATGMAEKEPAGPLVSNGDFEGGRSGWTFYTDAIGIFAVEAGKDGTAAKILVSKPGSSTELFHPGIRIDPGAEYRLSFSARSSLAHDVSVSVMSGDESKPYGAGGRVFDLSPDWQDFSFDFTASGLESAVSDARLIFQLSPYASIGDEYWFDDVSLERIDSSDASSTLSSAPAKFESAAMDISGIPQGVAIADMNGDGIPDFIASSGGTAENGASGIGWYEGLKGSNAPGAKHEVFQGDVSGSIAAYDVNGDGARDIIATSGGSIWWFENPGSAAGASSAWKKHYIGAGNADGEIHIADIDGDGKKDIVAGAIVYFQDDIYDWTPRRIGSATGQSALLSIDSWNGAINLVATHGGTFVPAWYENPREYGGNARADVWSVHDLMPDSDFPSCTVAACVGRIGAFATADMNGDGRQDIVSGEAGPDSSTPLGGLTWWEAPQGREGDWTKHVIDGSLGAASFISVGDLNGDGSPDIIASGQSPSGPRSALIYNDGTGNFPFHDFSLGNADIFAVTPVAPGKAPSIFAGVGGADGLKEYLNQNRVFVPPAAAKPPEIATSTAKQEGDTEPAPSSPTAPLLQIDASATLSLPSL